MKSARFAFLLAAGLGAAVLVAQPLLPKAWFHGAPKAPEFAVQEKEGRRFNYVERYLAKCEANSKYQLLGPIEISIPLEEVEKILPQRRMLVFESAFNQVSHAIATHAAEEFAKQNFVSVGASGGLVQDKMTFSVPNAGQNIDIMVHFATTMPVIRFEGCVKEQLDTAGYRALYLKKVLQQQDVSLRRHRLS